MPCLLFSSLTTLKEMQNLIPLTWRVNFIKICQVEAEGARWNSSYSMILMSITNCHDNRTFMENITISIYIFTFF